MKKLTAEDYIKYVRTLSQAHFYEVYDTIPNLSEYFFEWSIEVYEKAILQIEILEDDELELNAEGKVVLDWFIGMVKKYDQEHHRLIVSRETT